MPRKKSTVVKVIEKADAGVWVLGLVSLIVLLTGFPFSNNAMTVGDVWLWFWKIAFAGTWIAIFISILTKVFKKWF